MGIPPETIKDSMDLGLPVPQYYVMPPETFCRNLGNSLGINVAEFEFPAYYNFFLKVWDAAGVNVPVVIGKDVDVVQWFLGDCAKVRLPIPDETSVAWRQAPYGTLEVTEANQLCASLRGTMFNSL